MPATARPASTRPHSPRVPSRPTSRKRYAPAVPSDGLTVDTELGSVDLVAVKRALSGDDRVRLTGAELDWIEQRRKTDSHREAAEIADALGTGYLGLLKAISRQRAMGHAAEQELAAHPF